MAGKKPASNSSHAIFASTAVFFMLLAYWADSWSVINLHNNNNNNNNNQSYSKSTRNAVRRVTFSPNSYCLVFENARSECLHLTDLLFNFANPGASGASNLQELLLASWCKVSHTKSWMVQGIDKLSCLFILEGCYYLLVVCYVLASCVAFCTVLFLVRNRFMDLFRHALTITTATLTFGIVVQWWVYTAFFVDSDALKSQGFSVSFGDSFCMVLLASWMYAIAGYTSSQASGLGLYRLARLHAIPRSDSEAAMNPLACPANYKV